jgi:ATP-binding cassette subfamily C protein
MLLFILLSAEFFIPMRQLGSLFHVAMNGISASDELFSYLELEEPVYGEQTELRSHKLETIQLEDVSVSYEGDTAFSVNNLNLELNKGKFTAVIGKSGSGKSTLVKLLSGDFREYSGKITWNHEDALLFSRELIQEKAVVINNHSYLYNTTIRENFLLANKHATDEMMWEVLNKVNLADFVSKQPDKLASKLDENGENLSGGQRQRLILARALLRESQLYIFDEITSGIDIESENNILEVIKELAQEKIVFFISHRLYNVLDADQIIVMEQGEILEKGSPKELLSSSTYFKTYFEEEEKDKGGLINERS